MRRSLIASAAAVVAIGVLAGCGPDAQLASTAVEEAAPTATPTPSPTAPRPVASPEPSELGSTATVTGIIDGDTLDTSDGRVRVIGIDTPERGQCGYDEATQSAAALLPVGSTVTLTPVLSMEDTDKYDRLLRYVTASNGTDLGLEQIKGGFADARYDSRDGYGAHPKEAAYVSADASPNTAIACAAAAPTEPPEAPAPTSGAEPWNMPGPDLDCADIGHRVVITGPDYHGLDRDGDGFGCDSY